MFKLWLLQSTIRDAYSLKPTLNNERCLKDCYNQQGMKRKRLLWFLLVTCQGEGNSTAMTHVRQQAYFPFENWALSLASSSFSLVSIAAYFSSSSFFKSFSSALY